MNNILAITPTMTGMAFGYADDTFGDAKHFNFDITHDGDGLMLTVDRYSATTEVGPDWDVDQWDAQKLFFTSLCTRQAFYVLSRIGRALLNGRNVMLPDGTVIPGVAKEDAI